MAENLLEVDEDGEEIGDVHQVGIRTRKKSGKGRRYTRTELLKVAKRCMRDGFETPEGMGGLDSWFGSAGLLNRFLNGQLTRITGRLRI